MNNETLDKGRVLKNSQPLWFKTFGILMKFLVPITFLGTGLILLYLSLPGWSLIIGIPSITFGIVFLLYSYDELCCQGNFEDSGEKVRLNKKNIQ